MYKNRFMKDCRALIKLSMLIKHCNINQALQNEMVEIE